MPLLPTPALSFPSPSRMELRLGDRLVFTASVRGSSLRPVATLTTRDQPARPLFLGYPHGPADAQFVPDGRTASTYEIRLNVPAGTAVDGSIRASSDSFCCTDRADAPLGSVYGKAVFGANGVYDRTSDSLLTAEGEDLAIQPKRSGYSLRAYGPVTIFVKPNYYQDHLGYFLWDRTKPLWKKPVAGWCSWMAYLQGVTARDILDAARFMSRNLKAYGYDVVQIDDGYQRVPQNMESGTTLTEPFHTYWTKPNEKFPDGLAPLAEKITALGITPGIWVGDYLPLGLRHKEGYVQDADGKPHKGPWVNYAVNASTPAARNEAYIDTIRELRRQGWRYFKIDTLRHVLYDSYRQVPEYWKTRNESMETAFRTLIAETKKAAGNHYVMACWGTMPELAGLPDGARIGEDVGPDFDSMRRTAKYIAQFQYLNNVVWHNDPDYMCLRVPVDQARTWASLTFLAGGHIMVSDPPSDYDEERIDVLRRVGPPLFLRPSVVTAHRPDPEIMTLSATKDGERWLVVGRFGWEDLSPKAMRLVSLGLPNGRYLAFDFWNERFLGSVQDAVPMEGLAKGACQVVSLRPELDRPQVLGTNRHMGQGIEELSDIVWDGRTLSGTFRRASGRAWSLYLHVPQGWRPETSEPRAERVSDEVMKLTFAEGSTPVRWSVRFSQS